MHIGSSGKLVMTSVDAPIDVLITLQPMNIVQCAADLIHSPVFRKFPDVTVALSEGGIGWIPYFLERLDHSYRTHKAWTGADFGTKMPSEVFMEHVMLCYINDGVGVKLARDIGIDRITVEIDYPHSDANWPTAPERMMEEFDATDLTDAEINSDDARERDAVLPVRPVRRSGRASSARSARCAPRPTAGTSNRTRPRSSSTRHGRAR